jgi:formate dehydrogenase major subunit
MTQIQRDDVRFTIDGVEVVASPYETIWQAASRIGKVIPHLCHREAAGYRPDGNCRSCLVEIEGEGLEPSCRWRPQAGMKVLTESPRARRARGLVMELLLTDQPPAALAHNPDAPISRWAGYLGLSGSRFPRRKVPLPDRSHPGITLNAGACIQCGLCVRACGEVQGHNVIGMAGRGAHARVVFDLEAAMGESTCIACGECVQACPTGALMPARLLDGRQAMTEAPDRSVDSVCPYCGVGCQISYQVKDNRILSVDGQDGPANQGRLCVKGRFGFDYVEHPHRLTTPLIRRADAAKSADLVIDPANPWTHFRAATWDEALDVAAAGLRRVLD